MCTRTKIISKSISFLVCHMVEPRRRQWIKLAEEQKEERRKRNILRQPAVQPPRNSKSTWSNNTCCVRVLRPKAPSQRISSSESHLAKITIMLLTNNSARGQISHRSRCMSRPTCCRRSRSWVLRWSMLTCLRWPYLSYPSLKVKLDAQVSFPYHLACRLSGNSPGSHPAKTTSPLKA